ncbi:hypothetical protein BJ508DRAFT_306393 [Ascobolus immersus RN42]|uniref:Uncharacterized protein n=1 Tax=Ascobolus immersus RN42 TaxID=1160509 RepID=A0A3N4I664_ASCIM|nr:hypothetical protein BJ508DRAFT_306393 [Ascobolus immersus RN42]
MASLDPASLDLARDSEPEKPNSSNRSKLSTNSPTQDINNSQLVIHSQARTDPEQDIKQSSPSSKWDSRPLHISTSMPGLHQRILTWINNQPSSRHTQIQLQMAQTPQPRKPRRSTRPPPTAGPDHRARNVQPQFGNVLQLEDRPRTPSIIVSPDISRLSEESRTRTDRTMPTPPLTPSAVDHRIGMTSSISISADTLKKPRLDINQSSLTTSPLSSPPSSLAKELTSLWSMNRWDLDSQASNGMGTQDGSEVEEDSAVREPVIKQEPMDDAVVKEEPMDDDERRDPAPAITQAKVLSKIPDRAMEALTAEGEGEAATYSVISEDEDAPPRAATAFKDEMGSRNEAADLNQPLCVRMAPALPLFSPTPIGPSRRATFLPVSSTPANRPPNSPPPIDVVRDAIKIITAHNVIPAFYSLRLQRVREAIGNSAWAQHQVDHPQPTYSDEDWENLLLRFGMAYSSWYITLNRPTPVVTTARPSSVVTTDSSVVTTERAASSVVITDPVVTTGSESSSEGVPEQSFFNWTIFDNPEVFPSSDASTRSVPHRHSASLQQELPFDFSQLPGTFPPSSVPHTPQQQLIPLNTPWSRLAQNLDRFVTPVARRLFSPTRPLDSTTSPSPPTASPLVPDWQDYSSVGSNPLTPRVEPQAPEDGSYQETIPASLYEDYEEQPAVFPRKHSSFLADSKE